MRINSVTNGIKFSPSFGDAFSTRQAKDYQNFLKEVRQDQNYQDGIRVVKVYTPALPSSSNEDTGIGKVSSKEAANFYNIAKTYYGATAVKFMPMGQFTDKPVYSHNKYAGAYNRAAFAMGEDTINFADLTTEKYGNILPRATFEKFVQSHKNSGIGANLIDFATTLGWKNQEDYPVNSLLRTVFDNFKNERNPNDNLKALRSEFEHFKTQKEPVDYDEIYTRLALFPYLKNWTTAKTDFFVGFDSDPDIRAQKMPEYERLKKKHAKEIEFYKFKQFLAHKTLADGKKLVNNQGMDLIGDCILGFSWPERQVFPDAFMTDRYGRCAEAGVWGLPALNYHELMDESKKDGPAHKLLKQKISHYLVNYDGIRFDVGWAYIRPTFHFGDNQFEHLNAGTTITDFIEQTAREIKGENFDQRKLMYECDADGNDFNLFSNKDNLDKIKGLAILSTENEKNDNANIGWGNAAFLKETIGLKDDDISIGTGNHDGQGVLRCAHNKDKSNEQIGALMRVFRLRPEDGVNEGWREFKDNDDILTHIQKYSRARFAEIETCKNTFIQSNDLLGREEKVDYHTDGTGEAGEVDYKQRLERNYETNFHKALQDGVGYNAADAHKFRMEHDGTKERRPDLYEKACKYAAYLQHKGGIYTQAQADKSERADLDIESMSVDEIKNLDKIA